MSGYPCMCGGCPRCLRDQGVYECPHCGAFGGCDCQKEPTCPGCGKWQKNCRCEEWEAE